MNALWNRDRLRDDDHCLLVRALDQLNHRRARRRSIWPPTVGILTRRPWCKLMPTTSEAISGRCLGSWHLCFLKAIRSSRNKVLLWC